MPDTPTESHGLVGKVPTVQEGLAAYQVVGEVTAHQADDG
jgi:hypothetical protein